MERSAGSKNAERFETRNVPFARLFCTLAPICWLVLSACSGHDARGYRFAVLGDSRGSLHVFPAIIDSLNRIDPDLVIHLGDFIHGYTDDMEIIKKQWQLVDRQLFRLRPPLFVTPGNHDTYTGKATADPRLVRFLDERYNRCPFSLQHRGALLLFLNSVIPGEEETIGRSQIQWLNHELRQWASRDGPAFLFVHHPLVSPAGRSIKNANEVLSLLDGSPVTVIFCSHDHMYKRVAIPSGIVQYITGGGGASLRGLSPNEGGFYHFLIAEGSQHDSTRVTMHRVRRVVESEQSWPPNEYEH